MSECAGKDLQNARIRADMRQWEVANACNVGESTIRRWESDSNESKPQPDDIDRYAQAVNDPTLWHRWMLSHYDSYRRRYINGSPDNGLFNAMARLKYEMEDVFQLHGNAERDSFDGKIDDLHLKAQYIKELKDMIAAATDALQELLK